MAWPVDVDEIGIIGHFSLPSTPTSSANSPPAATSRAAAAPVEPRAVGKYDRRTGPYTLHTGTQMPHGLRRFLAEQVFGMPQCHVRVVSGDGGERFGTRDGVYPELVLWGARRLGRPVKWPAGRREGFLTEEHGRDNVSTSPAGRRSGAIAVN